MDNMDWVALEQGLVEIGDQLIVWRDDRSARTILEPKEFKTGADKKAHQLIRDLISRVDDEHAPILSEEDDLHVKTRPGAYWLIDPLDGTASWYDGFDGFVTQIAYIRDGTPLYGAIYAPARQRLWSARKGEGAFVNGAGLPLLSPREGLILTDNYPEPRHAAKRITTSMSVDGYIECGSFGFKACLVAEGSADLFVKDVVFRDWDIAPACVILSELGGVVCDLKGRQIYFTGDFEKYDGLLISRESELAEKVLEIFR